MPVLDETLQHYLRWPTLEEWSNPRGNWNKIEMAVGKFMERVVKYVDLVKIKNSSTLGTCIHATTVFLPRLS